MRSGLIIVVVFVLAAAFLAWRDLRYRPESTNAAKQMNVVISTDPVLVSAGDIASCDNDNDEATARILDGIDGTVVTLGDNVYPGSTIRDFENCFEPTWGRHKGRIKPVPGNHEYYLPKATDYFSYFGEAAGEPERGYYSFDLAAWHIVVLNSNCGEVGGCGENSKQQQWLLEDLKFYPATCTLAAMHHPRFSSGQHGSTEELQPLWRTMYEQGVDVVLAGHDHTYERFKPMDLNGKDDPPRGIREFVVGSGGRSHYNFGTPLPTSEVRDNTSYGVVKLTLHNSSYDWEFIPVAGATFRDSGSGTCH